MKVDESVLLLACFIVLPTLLHSNFVYKCLAG